MTHIIKYPIKFYLFDLILYFCGFIISGIGICVLLAAHNWWTIGYAVLFLIAAAGLISTVCNMQWIKIDNEYISAYNVFGLVKRLELSKTQTVSTVNAVIFGVKTYHKRHLCILISHRKSLNKSRVENAYNQKKNPYIILPYSEENKLILEKLNFPPLKNPHSY